ncbi:transposase, partial [Alcaligenaceae bacterium]|nr:transposase [Alcaligenaceae bacterium]
MPNRTTETLDFGRMGRRRLEANFEGGDLSSDGGLMLLRQIDAHTGLSRLAAKALTERRDTAR